MGSHLITIYGVATFGLGTIVFARRGDWYMTIMCTSCVMLAFAINS